VIPDTGNIEKTIEIIVKTLYSYFVITYKSFSSGFVNGMVPPVYGQVGNEK
jgi:hypothetical protein